MLIPLLCILWFVIGYAAAVHYCASCSRMITLADLLVSLLFGLLMPMSVVVWLCYFSSNIVIWRSKC